MTSVEPVEGGGKGQQRRAQPFNSPKWRTSPNNDRKGEGMNKSWSSKITAIMGVLLVASAVLALATGTPFKGQQAGAAANQVLVGENAVTGIYSAASPAVVEIQVTSQNTTPRGSRSMGGQGSGFLIDNAGDILTNNHVIDGAASVQVIFNDGRKVSATVLGKDSADDLAVVKVDASVGGITPLTLSTSTVKPGQMAIAIGSPYGLTNSISVGIVSGLNRNVAGSGLNGMIQTDANIQPGNSGGPLLDSTGQVIGINTAFEGQGMGIGFAIPSSVASRVLPDLKANKQISRPWIGISGLDLTQDQATNLGLTVNQGVYVVSVVSGSPAEKAGLKAGTVDQNGAPGKGGDVITAIDNNAVKSVADIQNYLANKNVGDTVTLTINRNGANATVTVILAARPADNTQAVPRNPMPQFPFPNIPWPWNR
jgi:S1-C subfamily serine protease